MFAFIPSFYPTAFNLVLDHNKPLCLISHSPSVYPVHYSKSIFFISSNNALAWIISTDLSLSSPNHSSAISSLRLIPSNKFLISGIIFFSSRMSIGASLVAQWLRICLLMQGTRVRDLVWEDPTCHGATGPVSHNYWACASGAYAPRQQRPR